VKYNAFLNQIEEVMTSSGIRNYCSNICLGSCCDGCYETKNACHRNEGRRLACSLFICANLKDILFSDHQRRVHRGLNDDAIFELGKTNGSDYYQPYSKKRLESFDCRTENLKKFVAFMSNPTVQEEMVQKLNSIKWLFRIAKESEKRMRKIKRNEAKKRKERKKKNESNI